MSPSFSLTPTSSDGDPFCTQEFCDDGLTDGNNFEYVSGSSFSFVFIYNRVRQDPVVRHCVYGDVMGSANTTRNIQQDTSSNVYGVKYSFNTVTANITCDPVGTPAFAAWAEVYIRVISGGPWVLYRLSETPTGSYGGGGVSYTEGNIVITGEAVSLTVNGSPIALPYSGSFDSFEYTAPEATELPTALGIPIYFQPQVAPSYHFPLTSVAATGDPFCTDSFCDDTGGGELPPLPPGFLDITGTISTDGLTTWSFSVSYTQIFKPFDPSTGTFSCLSNFIQNPNVFTGTAEVAYFVVEEGAPYPWIGENCGGNTGFFIYRVTRSGERFLVVSGGGVFSGVQVSLNLSAATGTAADWRTVWPA